MVSKISNSYSKTLAKEWSSQEISNQIRLRALNIYWDLREWNFTWKKVLNRWTVESELNEVHQAARCNASLTQAFSFIEMDPRSNHGAFQSTSESLEYPLATSITVESLSGEPRLEGMHSSDLGFQDYNRELEAKKIKQGGELSTWPNSLSPDYTSFGLYKGKVIEPITC